MYIPVTIFDNFLADPVSLRNFALKTQYYQSQGHFPGFRSERLDRAIPEFEEVFSRKVIETLFDTSKTEYKWDIESSFQVIPAHFEEGWVHDDASLDGWNIAGILYLNESAPLNSGTSIYSFKNDVNYNEIDFQHYNNLKHRFYQGESLENYSKERDYFNSLFSKTIDVENVYNRLLVYSATELHKANNFFGTNVENSRMTLMFYMRVEEQNGH